MIDEALFGNRVIPKEGIPQELKTWRRLSVVEWHPLVDGDPPESGHYMLANAGHMITAIYWHPSTTLHCNAGWQKDVDPSPFTHWAKRVHAPRDGSPQLFRAAGRMAREDNDLAREWEKFSEAIMATPIAS
jgi:hypothetical protein